MVAVAKSGINFTDPREFLRSVIAAGNINNYDAAATGQASTAVAFFTEQDRRGVTDDTNWTADTYKTILSISSGIGLVSNLIGPTGLAGTPTTTFEITVDGVLTTVAVTATTTGQRAMLGAQFSGLAASGSFFTTAKNAMTGADSINASKDTLQITYNSETPTWQSIRVLGTPCLIFKQSLLIRMKSSESNSTTTNRERRSAVQYMSMT